jgi:hypothetical protein
MAGVARRRTPARCRARRQAASQGAGSWRQRHTAPTEPAEQRARMWRTPAVQVVQLALGAAACHQQATVQQLARPSSENASFKEMRSDQIWKCLDTEVWAPTCGGVSQRSSGGGQGDNTGLDQIRWSNFMTNPRFPVPPAAASPSVHRAPGSRCFRGPTCPGSGAWRRQSRCCWRRRKTGPPGSLGTPVAGVEPHLRVWAELLLLAEKKNRSAGESGNTCMQSGAQ